MKIHLLPYCDILCYCLMPNHFHWLICTNERACQLSKAVKPKERHVELKKENYYQMNLNNAIAILLRSYTSTLT